MKLTPYQNWIAAGIANGWCGPAICSAHDGIPTTAAEDAEYEEGYDPCIFVIRLYGEDEVTRKAVERNHSPSRWRK